MKSLLTLASILLLSGCVTYYYPQTALQDGVYYAEDDPSYVIDSSGYDDVSYYPWSSLDSFYLGYYPYSAYGYSGGHSFGISYAYSSWNYPPAYYGYYSPWYAWHAPYYHYSHHYAWRPYYGHGRHNYGHGNKHYGKQRNKGKGRKGNYRNDSDYRYAGNNSGNNDRGNRRGDYADDDNNAADRTGNRSYASDKQAPPVKRYVSTTPSGHSDTRGREIRSRGSKNSDKMKIQPIDNGSVKGIKLEPSSKRATQTAYRSKRSTGSAGEVRYSAGAKQGRSRTQPVKSTPNSNRNAVASVPARAVTTSANNGKNRRSLAANNAASSSTVKTPTQAGKRASSRRVSSSPASSSKGRSQSHRSSGNSKRSQPSSSSSGGRQSKQSDSIHKKNRN